jgi:hypothetical protein
MNPKCLTSKTALSYLRRNADGMGIGAGMSEIRTIQVCPKDLPAFLRQIEHAVDRPAAPKREGGPRCPT